LKYIRLEIDMPIKKDQWISAREAATIMSENSQHPVSSDYVRLLSNQGKIRARAINGREKEYHKGDVEGYRVRGKGKNKPVQAELTQQPSRSR
jgi:hypothetical protein